MRHTVEPSPDPGEEQFLEALNRALARADLPVFGEPGDDPERRLLIYIVGLPRSGTTLVSQLVARHLDVGYIDNLAARFWLRPSAGIRLSRAVLGPPARGIELVSHQAHTPGPAGPNEFGYFWRHWLRLDEAPSHVLSRAHLARLDAAGLAGALRDEIIAPFASAVMLKNVICGLQASWLARLHPRSLFVHVERDRTAVIRSILAARRERFGRFDAWWSVKPESYPWKELGADPVADVVRQCRDTDAGLRAALGSPGVRSLEARYEEICREPVRFLENLIAAAAASGERISMTTPPPEALSPSQGPALPEDLVARIAALAIESRVAVLP